MARARMTIAAAATTHGAADLSSAKRGVAPVSWYGPTRALSYNRLCFSEKVVERWGTRDVPYRPEAAHGRYLCARDAGIARR